MYILVRLLMQRRNRMGADNNILQFFPQGLRSDWERSGVHFETVQEIRLRVNQPDNL